MLRTKSSPLVDFPWAFLSPWRLRLLGKFKDGKSDIDPENGWKNHQTLDEIVC